MNSKEQIINKIEIEADNSYEKEKLKEFIQLSKILLKIELDIKSFEETRTESDRSNKILKFSDLYD
jgi:hypothetical protein